jgi:hypothetical protein
LTLNHKADEAIQLFDWCGAAALQREKFHESVVTEQAKAADLEARITELRNQLDELTESKKAREAEILQKFCGLLNEKKVKIREQQRLLSTAQVDPSRLDAARASQAMQPKIEEDRKPAPSRRTKRKALEDASGGGSSSDSDDGFEKVDASTDEMDVDAPPKNEKESPESDDRETTDDDTTATGSEADEEEPPAPSPPPKARQPRKPEPKGRAAAASKAGKGTRKDVAIHPPRRALRKTTPKATSPPPAEGSETESDDEL